MPLTLNLEEFSSRLIRKAVSSDGIRRIAKSALEEKRDKDTNIIVKVYNAVTKFGNSLMGKTIELLTGGFKFAWTAFWGLTVSAVQFIWNFNWNASDADLDSQINSSFNSLAGTLGGTIGNALGWLACGAVPGVVIAAFNEPMGLYVLEQVGEEALEEIAGNLANLIKQTAKSVVRAATIWSYKNIRTLWRKPDSVFKQQLIAQGMKPDQVEKALQERNKPWSFAQKTEDFIDNIPNQFVRNFTEELFEEFGDACIEAGYVVAGSVDSYLAMQKTANQNVLGEEKTVEILLNRSADSNTTS